MFLLELVSNAFSTQMHFLPAQKMHTTYTTLFPPQEFGATYFNAFSVLQKMHP